MPLQVMGDRSWPKAHRDPGQPPTTYKLLHQQGQFLSPIWTIPSQLLLSGNRQ